MDTNGGFAFCGTQLGLQAGGAIRAVFGDQKEKETREVFNCIKPHDKYPQ